MSEVEKPLTARAFAKLTGIGYHTVRKAIASGELKSFEFGGRILIPASEMKRHLSNMEQTTNEN